MSRLRVRSCAPFVVLTASLLLSACGGGDRQDKSEPKGNFTVSVHQAKFPTSQRLAEHSHLLIDVRNDGNSTIPDVAVTITNPAAGTAAESFGEFLPQAEASSQGLASRSRPVWIIDKPPGLCGYSCNSGGPGGATTAYANTWALGALKPGATAKFDWAVTAVKAGKYVVQYEVAAGLNGKATAVLASGGRPMGRFSVTVHTNPSQAYVDNGGKVVKTK